MVAGLGLNPRIACEMAAARDRNGRELSCLQAANILLVLLPACRTGGAYRAGACLGGPLKVDAKRCIRFRLASLR
jgi:hypothetical protein